VLARLRERFTLTVEEVVVAEETVTFKLPASLQAEIAR
jgi:4-hydroxy-3-methylbut-2-enyl diphosphate reductase